LHSSNLAPTTRSQAHAHAPSSAHLAHASNHPRLHNTTGGFSELDSNKIKFPEISAPILEKVCQYFYYKLRHTNGEAWQFLPATSSNVF